MALQSELLWWIPYIKNEFWAEISQNLGLIFVIGGLIFLVLRWLKDQKIAKPLKWVLGLTVFTLIISFLSRIAYIYFTLKAIPGLGQFLVSGENSYFIVQLKALSWQLVIELIVAIAIFLTVTWIYKLQKKPWLDEDAPAVFLLVSLALGLPNMITGIALAFVLAVVYLLFMSPAKSKTRISISPFLLAAAAINLILSLFPFYDRFLSKLGLV